MRKLPPKGDWSLGIGGGLPLEAGRPVQHETERDRGTPEHRHREDEALTIGGRIPRNVGTFRNGKRSEIARRSLGRRLAGQPPPFRHPATPEGVVAARLDMGIRRGGAMAAVAGGDGDRTELRPSTGPR